MKKCSTPVKICSEKVLNSDNTLSPKESTLAFLRQFARVYRPAPAIGMPGIVLN